jgi:AraC-like DNA-binding protein
VTDAPTASTAGVLHPDEFARYVTLERAPAGPAVGRWVENHWSLHWDLPAGRRTTSQILPHPTCSLTVELATHPRPEIPPGVIVVVTGVVTERFDVDIRGQGRVLGVRFRPGGLSALTGLAASAWTDRTVAATGALPADLCATLADPALAADPTAWRSTAEAGVAALGATRGADPRYDLLLAIVADMLEDRALLTVADVGRRHGVTPRTLQRLFLRYLGVGPKWVLARYRLHDAVAALDDGYEGGIAELAQSLGWYDQAHFTREFTALVGQSPGAYRNARPRDGTG